MQMQLSLLQVKTIDQLHLSHGHGDKIVYLMDIPAYTEWS